ncbi:hypothetical protein QUB80_02230 [Chlorogloeopsis sp. ULAP01]|uniref:hypothetical protein n=1 Tax=Chlorogloeopsis sp. ULAP01 TaxID=3056483 RepID=UPI0025AACD0E|nr:hypothetical protein [Chlorogloeopsis sp. ULAP01]MDM9379518.1 hypothetical protein [Chlorogloeopsis sp. ULAP01]
MFHSKIARHFTRLTAITIVSVTATVGTMSTTTKPAQASLDVAVNFLDQRWGDLVSHLWTPWNKQVFMTNLSPQETKAVQNQYRSRADGVLFDRCVNKTANMYYKGWKNGAIKTTHRWVIAMRVENGQANCFQRMPNQYADAFIRRRGW